MEKTVYVMVRSCIKTDTSCYKMPLEGMCFWMCIWSSSYFKHVPMASAKRLSFVSDQKFVLSNIFCFSLQRLNWGEGVKAVEKNDLSRCVWHQRSCHSFVSSSFAIFLSCVSHQCCVSFRTQDKKGSFFFFCQNKCISQNTPCHQEPMEVPPRAKRSCECSRCRSVSVPV